jgi:hypothetical protein
MYVHGCTRGHIFYGIQYRRTGYLIGFAADLVFLAAVYVSAFGNNRLVSPQFTTSPLGDTAWYHATSFARNTVYRLPRRHHMRGLVDDDSWPTRNSLSFAATPRSDVREARRRDGPRVEEILRSVTRTPAATLRSIRLQDAFTGANLLPRGSDRESFRSPRTIVTAVGPPWEVFAHKYTSVRCAQCAYAYRRHVCA